MLKAEARLLSLQRVDEREEQDEYTPREERRPAPLPAPAVVRLSLSLSLDLAPALSLTPAPTPSPTLTPTLTFTLTPTPTPTLTLTLTPTPTLTLTLTVSPTPPLTKAEADMMTIEITVPPNHKEGAKLMCRRASKVGPLLLGPLSLAEPLQRHWPLAASLAEPALHAERLRAGTIINAARSLVITPMAASRCRMPNGAAHTVLVPPGAAPGARLRFKVRRPQGMAPPAPKPA